MRRSRPRRAFRKSRPRRIARRRGVAGRRRGSRPMRIGYRW